MKKLLLIGAGGHCQSVIDSIRTTNEYEVIGILDLAEKVGERVGNVPVIGVDEDMGAYFDQEIKYAFLSLGSTGDVSLRFALYQKIRSCGFQIPNIVDASAVVSPDVKLGQGTFVGKGAIINAGVTVGETSIINTGTIVEHSCHLDSFVHIASGATLCGEVIVGENTHIGAGSTVIQGVEIGSNTIIGAGSVVIQDMPSGIVAYGVPCRKVKEK